MSSSESEWDSGNDCEWEWGVPEQGRFAPGKDIGLMTYKEMYDTVIQWHIKAAGEHLCVHCRLPYCKSGANKAACPAIVTFYCGHGRDHGNQAGHKSPVNETAARVDRTEEKLRTKFTECGFKCTVRRVCMEGDGCAPQPEDGTKALSGHHLHLTNPHKFMWYFDSFSRQESFKQKGPRTENQQWTHSGHLKGSVNMGRLSDIHHQYIEDLVNQHVGVPSIQSGLLAKFQINFSDQQIYHALKSMGYNVTDDGLVQQTFAAGRSEGNDCMTFLKNLGRQKDVTFCVLGENLETSTETTQVFQTYMKGFAASDLSDLLMVDDDYDGTDCCRKSAPPKTGMAARDGEELVHGRIYDKNRFITINGQRMFYISILWIQKRELRNFQAYPEVLIMDDKKKTNKHGHSFFAGVGVDALWRNNTLFRSWSPNNTHDALNWMMTVAVVHLLPQTLRSRIKCVFTDHCGTMTPILAKVCGDPDVFPNARHFLCVYHVVRNFFQEFGQGHSKKWRLKSSTQQYRKGGKIEWAYAWQKNCASAIFRLAVCETRSEFEACKMTPTRTEMSKTVVLPKLVIRLQESFLALTKMMSGRVFCGKE